MVRRNILVFVRALGISLPRFDEKYIKAIRELPCASCGAWPPSEPSHPRELIWGAGGQLKAPDETAIPECRPCHLKYHKMENDWEERIRLHTERLRKTWIKLGKPLWE